MNGSDDDDDGDNEVDGGVMVSSWSSTSMFAEDCNDGNVDGNIEACCSDGDDDDGSDDSRSILIVCFAVFNTLNELEQISEMEDAHRPIKADLLWW